FAVKRKSTGFPCFSMARYRYRHLPTDLDLCFVDPDRATMRSAELAQPLLNERCIGKDPAIDGAVVHFEAALAKHLFQVAVAQRISQIPSHGLHNQPCLEMSPFEIILRLAL